MGLINMSRILIVKFIFIVFIGALVIFNCPRSSAQVGGDDFPQYEVESKGKAKAVIVYMTGDGGWNSFSNTLCKTLAESGYQVIALDSKKYFWEPKSPNILAADMVKIVKSAQSKWKIESWILIGYSFGADVGSFIPSHLSENILYPVRCIYLTPSESSDFEIKINDMLNLSQKKRKYDVRKEIEKAIVPTLCLLSEDEFDEFYALPVKTKILPGDHRFDNNFSLIVKEIISFIDNK